MMGNDEHSQNVYKRAVEQGFGNRPLEYCDRMEAEFRSVWSALDLSFDDFIRTTEPRHKTAVQKLAQIAYDKGDIYEGVYEGLVLRLVRGVQAGEGSRRRQVPAASDADAGVDSGKELLLPAVEVSRRAPEALRAITRSSCSRTCDATRSCGCSKPGSKTSR